MPPSQFFDLLNALSSRDSDKFDKFNLITAQYKACGSNLSAISTKILIPKNIVGKKEKSKFPILVRIHGGFLVTGSSLYAPWFSNWILDYAVKSNAIILSPNYRLLPEANGNDILKDMNDFWDWLHAGGLAKSLSEDASHSGILPDLDKILVVGESAGGYLAIQLALNYPSMIRGVVAAYPMLDLESDFYAQAYSKPIMNVPNLPNDLIEDHLANNRLGFITEADPPERLELAFSIVQNGRFLEFFGTKNPDLFPMKRLRGLDPSEGLVLPPLFVFHGEQDSAVPVDGSKRFVSLLRQTFPGATAQLYIQAGDHGFDADATLKTPWLKAGLAAVSGNWLGSTCKLSHI